MLPVPTTMGRRARSFRRRHCQCRRAERVSRNRLRAAGEMVMAVSPSFKQECPSCEAMVAIKDPSLIGKKVECAKCKYRFVVEDPVEQDESAVKAASGTGKKSSNGTKSSSLAKKKKTHPAGDGKKRFKDEELEEIDERPLRYKAANRVGKGRVGPVHQREAFQPQARQLAHGDPG
jgi:hypothetical protein